MILLSIFLIIFVWRSAFEGLLEFISAFIFRFIDGLFCLPFFYFSVCQLFRDKRGLFTLTPSYTPLVFNPGNWLLFYFISISIFHLDWVGEVPREYFSIRYLKGCSSLVRRKRVVMGTTFFALLYIITTGL